MSDESESTEPITIEELATLLVEALDRIDKLEGRVADLYRWRWWDRGKDRDGE